MTAAFALRGTIFTLKQVSITIMTPEGREPGQAMSGAVADTYSHNINISPETLTDDEAAGPPPILNEDLLLILAELYIDIS